MLIKYSERMDRLSPKAKLIRGIRLRYLGYVVSEQRIESNPVNIEMLEGRNYCIELVDEKSKSLKSYDVIGAESLEIEIS